MIVAITGPSGSGKTTLRKWLIREKVCQSGISCTTRPPREDEKHGVDYYFIDPHEFAKRIMKKEFIEWARYGAYHYGLPVSELHRQGKPVCVILDTEGIKSLRKHRKDLFVITLLVDNPDIPASRKARDDLSKWEGLRDEIRITSFTELDYRRIAAAINGYQCRHLK